MKICKFETHKINIFFPLVHLHWALMGLNQWEMK